MSSLRPPTREQIDTWFTAVLAGTRTRDEADRWAAQWHQGPGDESVTDSVTDEVVRRALGLLFGVDMPAGPTGELLHDDEQLREWLAEFRGRCRSVPAPDVA